MHFLVSFWVHATVTALCNSDQAGKDSGEDVAGRESTVQTKLLRSQISRVNIKCLPGQNH